MLGGFVFVAITVFFLILGGVVSFPLLSVLSKFFLFIFSVIVVAFLLLAIRQSVLPGAGGRVERNCPLYKVLLV